MDTSALLHKVAARAKDDPEAILPVLRALAGESPWQGGDAGDLHRTALEINRARVLADRAAFTAHSWSAEQVAEHLGVHSRQAVAQRRQRGTLLGAKVGGQVRYPEWQFGPEGLATGLPALLALLRGAGIDDAEEADDVLRMRHAALRHGTLLATWRRGDLRTVERWLGDMAGWRR